MQQPGAGALGVQRVHRHVPAAQVQQLQQLRQGGDLVGLAVHGHLADAQADVGCERVQQVQRRNATPGVCAAPHGLAVDGDLAPGLAPGLVCGLAPSPCGDTPCEVGEHRLELLRPDEPQQPPERVVGRRAVLVGQVTAQEVELTQRRREVLRQTVSGPADDPWIIDPGE